MESTKADKICAEPVTYNEDEVKIAYYCIRYACGCDGDFYDDDPEEFNSFW